MADRDRDRPHPHQLQVHPQHQRYEGGVKSLLPDEGPSAGKVVAVATLLPVGGSLLGLSGITLVGTLIGLALAAPVFLLFSPVLVPAALVLGLAVAGFIASGAFGLTALSSLSWVANCVRQATGSPQDVAEQARRRMQDMAVQMGQKTKEVGQTIERKGQEGGGGVGTGGGGRT